MIKKILVLLNSILIKNSKVAVGKKNSFFLVRLNLNNTKLCSNNSIYEKSIINTTSDNEIHIDKSLISNSSISIHGKNNQLIIEKNVKLRNVTINIRGDNCKVIIGENTSFGGARIVNVGINNDIIIGKNCLFSDNIEIWASDTHSIFDENGFMINHEKPIIIEDNVWVGAYVRILKGVKIGKGSVIGINSLLTKDIEEKTLCAGNPIKILKRNISWNLDYKGIK